MSTSASREELNARARCTEDPRGNSDAFVIDAKRARLHGSAFGRLRGFVESIRREDRLVPDFDPFFGDVGAHVLVLLEAPGAKATIERGGSGFISPDNADNTASTVWRLVHDSGLRREDLLFWNVVPWYLGDESRIAAARPEDITDAAEALRALIGILPDLRVVLTLGTPARNGWLQALLDPELPLVPTLAAPHPSPRSLAGRPAALKLLQLAFTKVGAVVDD